MPRVGVSVWPGPSRSSRSMNSPNASSTTFRTNTEILNGLQDAGNDAVWQAFVARYRPVLVAFARRLGLADDAAEDAAQDALISFLGAYRSGGYVRDRGRLRSWLFGIAANAIRKQRHRAPRERLLGPGDGSSAAPIEAVRDERTWSDVWELEWRQAVLKACLGKLRETTEPHSIQAFELYVLGDWPAERVADALGMSRDAVFQTKRRLLTRLREIVADMERDF